MYSGGGGGRGPYWAGFLRRSEGLLFFGRLWFISFTALCSAAADSEEVLVRTVAGRPQHMFAFTPPGWPHYTCRPLSSICSP